MFRKTLTIFSLIGLLLSMGLWVASYWRLECFGGLRVSLHNACVTFGEWHASWDGTDPQGWGWVGFAGIHNDWVPAWNFARISGLHYEHFWSIRLPMWIPVLLFSVLLWLTIRPYSRGRTRKRLGLCLRCGYDLRGSNSRCPECNEPILPDGRQRSGALLTYNLME